MTFKKISFLIGIIIGIYAYNEFKINETNKITEEQQLCEIQTQIKTLRAEVESLKDAIQRKDFVEAAQRAAEAQKIIETTKKQLRKEEEK